MKQVGTEIDGNSKCATVQIEVSTASAYRKLQ